MEKKQIKFGTGGFRGVIGDDFTKENVQRIAQGLADMMHRDGVISAVPIGYDNRFMSDSYALWIVEVLAANGIKCLWYDFAVPTPMVMCAVRDNGCDYGIMITASHNPYMCNGVKLFVKGGADADVSVTGRLETFVSSVEKVRALSEKELHSSAYFGRFSNKDEYLEHISAYIDPAISRNNISVLFDNLFGVAVVGLKPFFEKYRIKNCTVHAERDALFGSRLPNPTEERISALKSEVLRGGYDFAVATDSDGDRLGMLDEKGNYIGSNDILAMLYYYLVTVKGEKGDAVKNCATSVILDKLAAKFGYTCHTVDVGFKNISAKMRETNALIGGESSGGLTCRGYLFGKDSIFAVALFTEMRIVMDMPVSEIVRNVREACGYTYHVVERVVCLPAMPARDAFERLTPDFGREVTGVETMSGNFKWTFTGDCWGLIRLSGTEPVVRIFAEAETARETARIADVLENAINDDCNV